MSKLFEPIMGEEYQELAADTHMLVEAALNMIHAQTHEGGGDGGPILTGAICGMIAYAVQGGPNGMGDADLRKHFMQVFDDMLPKLRAVAALAGAPAGRA